MPLGPGIYYDLDEGVYRSDPAIANSDLKPADKTLRHYRDNKDGLLINKDSVSKRKGRLIHAAVFEPARFKKEIRVRPDSLSLTTKEGIEWKNETAELKLIGITETQFNQINQIARNIQSHPRVCGMLADGKGEVTVVTKWNNLLLKSRIDFIPNKGDIVLDLKTTDDIVLNRFARKARMFKYYQQGAYYLDNLERAGIKRSKFWFIVAEVDPPHQVIVYNLPKMHIETGRQEYTNLLTKIEKAERLNDWPGYPEKVTDLVIPELVMAVQNLG